ncbi:MAG: right-handed parallel beta-helix repeat-containing protein, partial [Nitrospirales bacterium]|nr:right-handed parallel beta-helix repeat-containing protein [Nitrospirales bacterium]
MILTPTTQILARIFAGVTLIFTIAIEAANATTYYVATNGNDSNPGTNSQPLRTITKGVKILSAGDTLYVKAGTYSESIRSSQISIPNGTSWNNPITIAANPGDTVTIKPLTDNAFFWILDGQSKYLIIKGFIVDGANKAFHGFKFEGGTKYVRVTNCEVKNAKHSGILVTTPSTSANNTNTHHEFINLKVHNNGSSGADHGFYINTSNNLVESSQFYNNKGNGGKFYHASFNGSANNNIARNNKFYNNSVAGSWSCGLLLSSGNGSQAYNNVAYGNYAGFCIQTRVTNARLFNNIAYENGYYGIYVGYNTTSGSKVENNTVYDNGTYGIFVGDDATSTTVKNNISLANPIDIGLQVAATNSNNFTSDPLFVNAGAKDFHLKSNSPAIDKGTSISGITI